MMSGKAEMNVCSRSRQGQRRGGSALALAAVLAAVLASALPASAAPPVTIASDGSGAGQVDNPIGVAVNQSSGDLYVADQTNRRIDKFDSAGNFLLAFGFGVADGHIPPAFQTCGPEASPPTVRCFMVEAFGGSGSSGQIKPAALAVDQSSGDIYVSDPSLSRVSVFSPAGQFLRAFGGGVASGGAEGSGDIQAGSTQVKSIAVAKRAFLPGQILTASGGGIPPGTEVISAYSGAIELSKPATQTASGVALTAAEDPGNVPTNEKQLLTLGAGVGSGNFQLAFTSPMGSTQTTANIPYNASAAQVQSALEALSVIGAGNVVVSSPNPGGKAGKPGGPYMIEFTGERHSDTNLATLVRESGEPDLNTTVGTTIETTQEGAVAAEGCTSDCLAGAEGSLPGQFGSNGPGGLAFDSAGDLWAADAGRLQRFSPAGAFLSQVQIPADSQPKALAIDPSTHDFYVLGPRSVDEVQEVSRSASGTYTLTLNGQTTAPIPFDATPKQLLEALEALSTIGAGNVRRRGEGDGGADLIEFSHELGAQDVEQMTASGGSPAVTVNTYIPGVTSSVQRLDPSGALLSTLDSAPGDHPGGLGMDGAGNLYVADFTLPHRILKFNPSGVLTSQFGGGYIKGDSSNESLGNTIAVDDSAEALYLGNIDDDTVKSFAAPKPGPLPDQAQAKDLLPTTATLTSKLNPEGHAATYYFEYGTSDAYGNSTPTNVLPGTGFEQEEASAAIDHLLPEMEYHFRVVATNHCNGSEPLKECTVEGEDATFTTPSAVRVSAQWAIDVGAASAIFRAQLDPLGVAAEWWLEYGTEETYGSKTPAANLGAGIGDVLVSAPTGGLKAGTTYHYRFAAKDVRDGVEYVVHGPAHTVTTQVSGLGFELPDGRAWEQVSPIAKGGGLIWAPLQEIVKASASGEAFAYVTYGPIGEPEGNRLPERSSSLARHTDTGWTSTEINPPSESAQGYHFGIGYMQFPFFSEDLSLAAMQPWGQKEGSAGLLSAEASERTPYLRDNLANPVRWQPLVTGKEGFANVPSGTKFGGTGEQEGQLPDPHSPVEVVGTSPDLTHVVVRSSVPLSADAESLEGGGDTGGLYEWSEGALQLISRRPVTEGDKAAIGFLGAEQYSLRHAVSEDGRYVYWSTGSASNPSALFLRDTVAGETVRLDVPQPGAEGKGEDRPIFQGASADGTRAFFTDIRELTEGSGSSGSTGNEKADLYACEVTHGAGGLECAPQDLTPEAGQIPADVQGVLSGMSEDGDDLYFVANGVLATGAGQGNCAPASPASTTCSLYHAHYDGAAWSTAFVATLSNRDSPDWGRKGGKRSTNRLVSSASPSGRYFAFMSERSLSGYDNRDTVSGEADQEVYRYDSVSEELLCVSCNPSGARPRGAFDEGKLQQPFDWIRYWEGHWVAANLPDSQSDNSNAAYNQPRNVLDNGRVLFNAFDALVPADSNGTSDAYQYEPHGMGSCTPSSGGATTVQAKGEGCVSLLSSGGSEREAAILESSASGDDVFIMTTAKLSVLDVDDVYDVYDVRVGGIPARRELQVECQGEACQPPYSPPNDPTPASSSFQGAGNVREEAKARCAKPKHQAKRKGKVRCVSSGHGRKQKQRAKHDRRAGR